MALPNGKEAKSLVEVLGLGPYAVMATSGAEMA